MKARLKSLLMDLMRIPGLSGHEDRVRRRLTREMQSLGVETRTDRLGNLIATSPGDPARPSVMLFTHMDQLGLIVRKIEASGLLRVERLGGVPERALASQEVLLCLGEGRDLPALIANKSHHATTPEEKYKVLPYAEIFIDAGFASAAEAQAAGVKIGTPIVYAPNAFELANERIAGTAVDDRAGCAVIVETARALVGTRDRPTVHFVFSVQEEFNLRGAVVAAQTLLPDIAIQLDLMLATDTPDMAARGDVTLGGGPAISLYSFHGRGTLNGTLPHPALVDLFERSAQAEKIALQRSAQVGVLTDASYVQLVGQGVASIDVGFPCRYTHSSLEVCALDDLVGLTRLLVAAIPRIDQNFPLNPRRARSMKAYLGIDIGTYESKGALVDSDGRVLASAARAHKMIVPQPGWAEHRAEEDWWGDFCAISQELIARSGLAPADIKAVGASGIGPCVLPVDEVGAPLCNAILYGVDVRAAREIEDLNAEIGEATIFERCGNALTSQSTGPKILWLKRHRPEIFARAHKFLNSSSFLTHRLTGRFVVDHYTAANATPLYDAEALDWTADLAPDLVSLAKLPELAWSTQIAGGVTARAAAQTGLAEGTPVIVGTIDASAEAVSVGVLQPGRLMLMYGTTMFMVLVAASRARDPRLWWAPWLFPGQHASLAGLATSGALTHWFRDQLAPELDPAGAMAALAAEAATSPPGARGLVFLPYFSGERTPIHDPHAKGLWFGLNLTHTRADLYRALLEGVGFGTRHVLETYAEAGLAPQTIHAVGGGVRNKVWLQATSDIMGREQATLKSNLGAAYGDAFLAALAVGEVEPDAIERWNPTEARVTPSSDLGPLYDRRYTIFRELYARNRDLMAALDG